MKVTEYVAVLVRLFAIALALYGVQQSSSMMSVLIDDVTGLRVPLLLAIGTVMLPIIVAVILWVFPNTVAKSIAKPEVDVPIEPLSAQSMLTILVIAIAGYYLFYSIVDLIYWAILWNMSINSGVYEVPIVLENEDKSAIVASIIEFVFSGILLMKSRFVASKALLIAR